MKPEIKLYYIIPAIFLVILVVVVLLLPKNKSETPGVVIPTQGPLPTRVQLDNKTVPSRAPTLIPHPKIGTGASDEQNISKEETDLATQKRELRKKTPLTQSSFTMTFDFSTDQFIVVLNAPKNTNQTVFNEWLKKNYPGIPLDRFSFK
ncbi:hypothetical protein HZC27_02150 [Candidatus Roizmanbacteria bacterium]|nr:hypothetical protein [Candidatus Roizmanbacteria bacterium]